MKKKRQKIYLLVLVLVTMIYFFNIIKGNYGFKNGDQEQVGKMW